MGVGREVWGGVMGLGLWTEQPPAFVGCCLETARFPFCLASAQSGEVDDGVFGKWRGIRARGELQIVAFGDGDAQHTC